MSLLNNIAREIGQHKAATSTVRVERPACRQGFHEWVDVTITTTGNSEQIKLPGGAIMDSLNPINVGWQQCVWCGAKHE